MRLTFSHLCLIAGLLDLNRRASTKILIMHSHYLFGMGYTINHLVNRYWNIKACLFPRLLLGGPSCLHWGSKMDKTWGSDAEVEVIPSLIRHHSILRAPTCKLMGIDKHAFPPPVSWKSVEEPLAWECTDIGHRLGSLLHDLLPQVAWGYHLFLVALLDWSRLSIDNLPSEWSLMSMAATWNSSCAIPSLGAGAWTMGQGICIHIDLPRSIPDFHPMFIFPPASVLPLGLGV